MLNSYQDRLKAGLVNYILHLKVGAKAMGYMLSRGQYKDVSGVNTPNVIMPEKKIPGVHGKRKLREKSSCIFSQKTPIIVLTSSKVELNAIGTYEPGSNNFEVKQEGFLLFSKAVSEPGWHIVPTNQRLV